MRSKSCFGQKAVAKHSAAGNFVCLTCGKKLKRQRSLELHMRQHTGEKSYRVSPFIHCKYCTWCPRYTFEPVRITLMRIQIQNFTLMRIRIKIFPWFWSGPAFLLRCRSRCGFSLWCGSGSDFPKWCGSGSATLIKTIVCIERKQISIYRWIKFKPSLHLF